MGYTHYFPQTRDFTDAEWDEIKAAADMLAIPGLAFGWDGRGKPEISDIRISLNGDAKNGYDHETFEIRKEKIESFTFCKTAQKPYDMIVVAILCVCHGIAPGALDISSDGEPQDWFPGLHVAKTANPAAALPLKAGV
jgi:hypothetical protein